MEGRAQTMGEFMPLFRVAPDATPRQADPRSPAATSGGDRRREVLTAGNRDGAK